MNKKIAKLADTKAYQNKKANKNSILFGNPTAPTVPSGSEQTPPQLLSAKPKKRKTMVPKKLAIKRK